MHDYQPKYEIHYNFTDVSASSVWRGVIFGLYLSDKVHDFRMQKKKIEKWLFRLYEPLKIIYIAL